MAGTFAVVDQDVHDRIAVGNRVTAELNAVSTAIDGDAADTKTKLLGAWGNAHYTALTEINSAVVKLHTAIQLRNDTLQSFLTSKDQMDSSAASSTTTDAQAAGAAIATLPTR